MEDYLVFVGASILLVISPGQDMVFLLGCSIAKGRKAGALAAIGINVGAYVHLIAVIAGLSAIMAASAWAFTVIKYCGAAYLVFIGLQALFSRQGPLSLDTDRAKDLSYKKVFWQGFWSDVLNPKVAIFYLALLPQFVDPGSQNETVQFLILGMTVNMIAIVFNVALAWFASLATQKLRKNEHVAGYLNKVAGTVFVALGVRLAYEKL